MRHDHHCMCDRCCVARHASKQVRKDPSWLVTILISLFFWTAIGGLIVLWRFCRG